MPSPACGSRRKLISNDDKAKQYTTADDARSGSVTMGTPLNTIGQGNILQEYMGCGWSAILDRYTEKVALFQEIVPACIKNEMRSFVCYIVLFEFIFNIELDIFFWYGKWDEILQNIWFK